MALLTGLCSCGEKKQAQTENTPTDTTQTEDQKGSGPMKVLFVSNSTCYYFTDELYGMLTAAGYEDVTLALPYVVGCSI